MSMHKIDKFIVFVQIIGNHINLTNETSINLTANHIGSQYIL